MFLHDGIGEDDDRTFAVEGRELSGVELGQAENLRGEARGEEQSGEEQGVEGSQGDGQEGLLGETRLMISQTWNESSVSTSLAVNFW